MVSKKWFWHICPRGSCTGQQIISHRPRQQDLEYVTISGRRYSRQLLIRPSLSGSLPAHRRTSGSKGLPRLDGCRFYVWIAQTGRHGPRHATPWSTATSSLPDGIPPLFPVAIPMSLVGASGQHYLTGGTPEYRYSRHSLEDVHGMERPSLSNGHTCIGCCGLPFVNPDPQGLHRTTPVSPSHGLHVSDTGWAGT